MSCEIPRARSICPEILYQNYQMQPKHGINSKFNILCKIFTMTIPIQKTGIRSIGSLQTFIRAAHIVYI